VVPGSVTLLSRADVVPCKVATDLAKGRAWPDTEEVTGSNPVAPTNKALTSGNAGQIAVRQTLVGEESVLPFGKRSAGGDLFSGDPSSDQYFC
jgi:hypothetical protein